MNRFEQRVEDACDALGAAIRVGIPGATDEQIGNAIEALGASSYMIRRIDLVTAVRLVGWAGIVNAAKGAYREVRAGRHERNR